MYSNLMSEKINNLNPDNSNLKSSFEFLNSDLIEKLYKLFIHAENPNNPRNKNVLEGESYTIPFLAARLNLNQPYVLSVFERLPGCRIFFNPNKPPQVYFQNRELLEKFLKNLYENRKRKSGLNLTQKVNQEKNQGNPSILQDEKVENLENQIEIGNKKEVNQEKKVKLQNNNIEGIEKKLIESGVIKKNLELNLKEELKPEPLKHLNLDELKYLKLIALNNMGGVFLINRPRVDINQIKQEGLENIHQKRTEFIKKCLILGIVERFEISKFKFKDKILKYLID
jgi:hypothetical protein